MANEPKMKMKPKSAPTQVKASEALQQHQNLIFRRALEKLQSNEPLAEEELTEVKRREAEEAKQAKPKKEPRQKGRQTKLTSELIIKIRGHISAGNTTRTACLLCRIHESTFYRWLDEDDSQNPLLREFKEAIGEAEAECEARVVSLVQAAVKTNWQAGVWWLERKYPQTYGRREVVRTEHSGPGGTALPPNSTQIVVFIPENGRAISEPPKLGNGA